MLIFINFNFGTFAIKDMPIYLINTILISLSANGLSMFNKKKETVEEEKEEATEAVTETVVQKGNITEIIDREGM